MKHEVEKHLLDVLEAAQDILLFTDEMSFDGYTDDRLTKAAVERKFEIIGEALNRINKESPDTLNSISESRKIIAFRNLIIHGYDAVSDPIVWDVVQNKLHQLIEDVKMLI